MNKLKYFLKEKGLYKIIFINNVSTFMEKRRYIDRGKGQKVEVGLLFSFPFENIKEIEKLAPNMSEKEIIKSIKKMELVQSYDKDFINKNLMKEFHNRKDKLIKEAVKRGFYKYSTINEEHHNKFNKWFNNYATQKKLNSWCVDGMIGFADTTFERVEDVMYIAFAAGMESILTKKD